MVVDSLAKDASAEAGDVEDRAEGHAAAILKSSDALERHLLCDDVDVWKAPLLLHITHAAAFARKHRDYSAEMLGLPAGAKIV